VNTESITVVAGAVTLGLLQAYSIWRAKQDAAHTKSRLVEVTATQQSIKRVLDGPMGAALMKLAGAKEDVARLTLDPADQQAAQDARARSDEHAIIAADMDKEREALKDVALKPPEAKP
jgi:hypothetical protein